MSAAAGAYARLLLEQNVPKDRLDQARSLALDPALREALENPTYDRQEKQAVIERIFPAELHPFLSLLCDYGDYALLPGVLEEYDALLRRRDGVARITFTCCHEPTQEQRERIEALVCRTHEKTGAEWHIVHDPSLLGGFILTVDDWVLDRSLRTMAEDLRRYVKRGNAL